MTDIEHHNSLDSTSSIPEIKTPSQNVSGPSPPSILLYPKPPPVATSSQLPTPTRNKRASQLDMLPETALYMPTPVAAKSSASIISIKDSALNAKRMSQASSLASSNPNLATSEMETNNKPATKLYSHANEDLSSSQTQSVATHGGFRKKYSLFRKSAPIVSGRRYEDCEPAGSPIIDPPAETKTLESLRRKLSAKRHTSPALSMPGSVGTSNRSSMSQVPQDMPMPMPPANLLSYEYNSHPPVLNVELPRYSLRSSSIYSESNYNNSYSKPAFAMSRGNSLARQPSTGSMHSAVRGPPPTSQQVSRQSIISTTSRQETLRSPTGSTAMLPIQSYPSSTTPGIGPPRISFHIGRSSGLFSPNDLFGPNRMSSHSSYSVASNTQMRGAVVSDVPPVPPIPANLIYPPPAGNVSPKLVDILNYRKQEGGPGHEVYTKGVCTYYPDEMASINTITSSVSSVSGGLTFIEEYGAIINNYNSSIASRTMSISSSVTNARSSKMVSGPLPPVPHVPENAVVRVTGPPSVSRPVSAAASYRLVSARPSRAALQQKHHLLDMPSPLSPLTMPTLQQQQQQQQQQSYFDKEAEMAMLSPTSTSTRYSFASGYHSALSHQDAWLTPVSMPPMPKFPSDIDVTLGLVPAALVGGGHNRNQGSVHSTDSESESSSSGHSSWTSQRRRRHRRQARSMSAATTVTKKKQRASARRSHQPHASRRRARTLDAAASSSVEDVVVVANSRSLHNVKHEKVISLSSPVISEHASIVAPSLEGGAPVSPQQSGSSSVEYDVPPPVPNLQEALALAATEVRSPTDASAGVLKLPEPTESALSLQISERRASLLNIVTSRTSFSSGGGGGGGCGGGGRTMSMVSADQRSIISSTHFRGSMRSFTDLHRALSLGGASQHSVGGSASARKTAKVLALNKQLPTIPGDAAEPEPVAYTGDRSEQDDIPPKSPGTPPTPQSPRTPVTPSSPVFSSGPLKPSSTTTTTSTNGVPSSAAAVAAVDALVTAPPALLPSPAPSPPPPVPALEPSSVPSVQTINVYQVVHAYVPQLEDELVLRRGDQVVILHHFDDGWCLACLVAAVPASSTTDPTNYGTGEGEEGVMATEVTTEIAATRLVEGVCPKVCLTKEPVMTYTKPIVPSSASTAGASSSSVTSTPTNSAYDSTSNAGLSVAGASMTAAASVASIVNSVTAVSLASNAGHSNAGNSVRAVSIHSSTSSRPITAV